jgi:hypothetical protein
MLPYNFYTSSDGDTREERINDDIRDMKQAQIAITSFTASKLNHSNLLRPSLDQPQSSSTISPPVLSDRTDYSKNIIHPTDANYHQFDSNDHTRHSDTPFTRALKSHSFVNKPENNRNMILSTGRFQSSLSPRAKVTRKPMTRATSSSSSTTNVTIHIERIEVQARIIRPSPDQLLRSPRGIASTSQGSNTPSLSLKDYLKNRSKGKY